MLSFFKKLFFKARKYPRHMIHNGSMVVMLPAKDGTTDKWEVKVIDISFGGAAFIYEGSPEDLAESGLVSFSKGTPEDARYITVSDIECSKDQNFRKRGIKFEWKGLMGKSKLAAFIEEHGIEIPK